MNEFWQNKFDASRRVSSKVTRKLALTENASDEFEDEFAEARWYMEEHEQLAYRVTFMSIEFDVN